MGPPRYKEYEILANCSNHFLDKYLVSQSVIKYLNSVYYILKTMRFLLCNFNMSATIIHMTTIATSKCRDIFNKDPKTTEESVNENIEATTMYETKQPAHKSLLLV